MTITSILVANRGEIACRIIRTAKAQGLRALAVFSEADKGAPHVDMADDAYLLGPGPVSESYLRGDKILEAAQVMGADAVHPGYGFLSENADFARSVEQAGLIFIGPTPEAIDAMGNKAEAKRLMLGSDVPCIPGYEGSDQTTATLAQEADRVGYPVMVKAAAGGGGRGMRLVDSASEIETAIDLARSEAKNAFGSGELILEKAVQNPRHVEVQIFADTHGNIIHLGERDCSVQRRHQKVVEEAPCPVMTPALRAKMGTAAVKAAAAVSYRGAGTVEFLLDANETDFYFLEMNTRLQVEHPVTELVTGLDLVALQIAVANGDRLPLTQDEVTLCGHAIEVRLYAEDPSADYMPTIGTIDLWTPAEGPGIRVDDGIRSGQAVSPFYDAMLAKIIAYGENREVARLRALEAVKRSVLLGLKTNTAFLLDVLDLPDFIAGKATTALLGKAYPDGYQDEASSLQDIAIAAALIVHSDQRAASKAAGYLGENQLGWSSTAPLPVTLDLEVEDATHTVSVTKQTDGWAVIVEGEVFHISLLKQTDQGADLRVNGRKVNGVQLETKDTLLLAVEGRRMRVTRRRAGSASADERSDSRVKAPMPGVVISVEVEKGLRVTKGQTLAVLEAMKMQHPLTAAADGEVSAIHAKAGQQLAAGDVLIELELD